MAFDGYYDDYDGSSPAHGNPQIEKVYPTKSRKPKKRKPSKQKKTAGSLSERVTNAGFFICKAPNPGFEVSIEHKKTGVRISFKKAADITRKSLHNARKQCRIMTEQDPMFAA